MLWWKMSVCSIRHNRLLFTSEDSYRRVVTVFSMSISTTSFWMNNKNWEYGLNHQGTRRKYCLPWNPRKQNIFLFAFYYFLKKSSSWKIKFKKFALAGAETKLLSANTCTHSCFHCFRSLMAAEGKWRTYEFFYFIQFEQNNAGSIYFPWESVDIWLVILLSPVMAPLGDWLVLLLLHKIYTPEAAAFIGCHQYGNSHIIFEEHNYLFWVHDFIR